MTDIANSILAINANAKFSVRDEDLNNITWHDGTTPISPSDILAKQQELVTTYNSLAYQRSRAAEYPEIKEQLDLLYKDMLADKGDKSGTWFAAVKVVKDKYAKE